MKPGDSVPAFENTQSYIQKDMFPEIHDLDDWHGGIFDKVTDRITDEEMKTADKGPKPESRELQEELGSINDNIILRTYSDDQYESIDELVKFVFPDVKMR